MRGERRHRTRWGSFVGGPTSSERFTRGNAGALQVSRARSYRGEDMFECECQDVFVWMRRTFEYWAKSALLLRMIVRAGQDSMSECSDQDWTQFVHACTHQLKQGRCSTTSSFPEQRSRLGLASMISQFHDLWRFLMRPLPEPHRVITCLTVGIIIAA